MKKEKSPNPTRQEGVRIKVCGLKNNIAEVAELHPEYVGFIFYEKSPRFFDGEVIPVLPDGIKKVGVFVNEKIPKILELTEKHSLDIIQLQGDESKEYVLDLQWYLVFSKTLIWKAFSIDDDFDFDQVSIFENKVDKFLFDTKGIEKGGNGITFNWEILKNYKLKKPFILSGGIGLKEVAALKDILQTDLPIYGIDVNSKFESEPGLKDVSELQEFQNILQDF